MNLKEQLSVKLNAQSALVNTAITAGNALSADEQVQFDNLETEIKALEKTIAAQEVINARKAEDNKPVNEPIYADPKNNKPVWSSFGEFMNAVRNAGVPGASADSRLYVKNAASGLNETVSSDGGFFVQQDFTSELMKRTYEVGMLPSRCRKIPISANANGLRINGVDETSRVNGSRWGGVQTYWQGEADLLVGSKPKFERIELELKKLTGLCYMTDELMSDAAALESVVTQAFADEFAFKLDDAILRGSGAGQPLGILNSPSLVTVAKTAAQTADTITLNNIQDMWMRTWGRSRQNLVWVTNQDCEGQLNKLVLPTGTSSGVAVYMPPTGVSGAPYSTLYGRPVMVMEHAATLGDLGDLILADFSQYLLIDKGGINTAQSIHVRFLYDENVFRFIYRVDGQPLWGAPLTPYKGSNTVSPFVTLAERA